MQRHTHTHTHRWLLASADDTAVPFFVSCGFSRKISIPKKIYSKVLTTYEVSPAPVLPCVALSFTLSRALFLKTLNLNAIH